MDKTLDNRFNFRLYEPDYSFVLNFRRFGFSTRSELIRFALRELRKQYQGQEASQ